MGSTNHTVMNKGVADNIATRTFNIDYGKGLCNCARGKTS